MLAPLIIYKWLDVHYIGELYLDYLTAVYL